MNKIVEIVDKGCFLVVIIGGTTSMIILISIIGLIKWCVEPSVDPLDDSYPKQREWYNSATLTDSTGVGFELLWYTTNPVTKDRKKEIYTREPIKKAQEKLLREAAGHFKHDFLHTDIHAFAKYARRFDVDPDVRLVNIFVYGMELEKQYLQPNPNLPGGGCIEYDISTQQGILYLEEDDIYCHPDGDPLYRYWKCRETSYTDERYTHFEEDERIQQ